MKRDTEKSYHSYQVRGKNALKAKFDSSFVTFEIREQFLTAPLTKNEAKKLIRDLEKWVNGEKV